MISNGTALRGKRVYRNSSYAPTRGKVKPQGYVAREMRKKAKKQSISSMGRDGKSDTRSGVAARILKKRRLMNRGN